MDPQLLGQVPVASRLSQELIHLAVMMVQHRSLDKVMEMYMKAQSIRRPEKSYPGHWELGDQLVSSFPLELFSFLCCRIHLLMWLYGACYLLHFLYMAH